ncbi:Mur ligase family protein [Patescibacteria group bacterium]
MFQKIKNFYHLFQAILANIYYGFPSRKLIVIGVTGTDGKTTTTSIIYQILKKSGKKAAMISSIGASIGEKTYDIGFHVTTPSPFGLQKYLRIAVQKECEYVVLETTSHGLDQFRVWGIRYEIGVLTNITREHLDYHKSYEEYARTKLKLIKRSKVGIVNMDDKSYELVKTLNSKFEILNKIQNSKFKVQKPFDDAQGTKGKRLVTYSLNNKEADFNLKNFRFETNMMGDFNKYNCLAAIAVVRELHINKNIIRKALKDIKIPEGRQEIVYDKDFRVIIDFAHTSNAFAKLLPEVKKNTKGRLIHLFGSAGERDAVKRPDMGRQSSKHVDIIVLTAEDPRSEKINRINSQIKAGILNKFYRCKLDTKENIKLLNCYTANKNKKHLLFEIEGRKQAIEFAIKIAKHGDTVVLTGKSHEKSMNLGNGEEEWDEYEVVKEAIVNKSKVLSQKPKA